MENKKNGVFLKNGVERFAIILCLFD